MYGRGEYAPSSHHQCCVVSGHILNFCLVRFVPWRRDATLAAMSRVLNKTCASHLLNNHGEPKVQYSFGSVVALCHFAGTQWSSRTFLVMSDLVTLWSCRFRRNSLQIVQCHGTAILAAREVTIGLIWCVQDTLK